VTALAGILAGLSVSGARVQGAQHMAQSKKRGRMEDPLAEMLHWLFVKTEEEIVAEAEVVALNSMFLAEDPRPARAGD
jgi:hypothetical protein